MAWAETRGGGTLPPFQILRRWAGYADEPERGRSPHTAGHVGYVSLVPLRMVRARDSAGSGSGRLVITLQHIVLPGRIGIGVP